MIFDGTVSVMSTNAVTLAFSSKMITNTFILILVLVSGSLEATEDTSFYYNDKDFSIRSTITRVVGDAVTETTHLAEFYSANQARAKLLYEKDGHPEDFYYCAKTGTSLVFSHQEKGCKEANLSSLFYNIFSYSQSMSDLLMSMEGKNLIGPMRFVSHLSSMTDYMQPMKFGAELRPPTIRNIEVVGFKLNITTPSDLMALVFIYYDTVTFIDRETSCKNLVPLRIALDFAVKDEIIMIDYSGLAIDTKPVTVPDMNHFKDELALPVGFDCSKTLPKVDPFEGRFLDNTRFSFIAHTITMTGREYVHYVALDGIGETLRVDSRETYKSALDLEAVRESTKLFDFHSNNRYIIIDNPQSKYGTIHGLLGPEILGQSDYRCALTEVYQPKRADQNILGQMGLKNLLLGANNFAYMGRARVRGIETEMYEAHTEMEPYWFSQPVVFKDSRGEWWVRTDEYNHGGTRIEYNVIIHMAAGRPLAMEMYDTGFNRLPTLTAQFYDFIWDLSEAPDGSRPHTLFDHHDACLKSVISGQASDNKYAEIELLLVGKELQGADWLNNVRDRQLSISAALRVAFDDRGFMLYDLESKVQQTEKHNDIESVRVSFHVVQHPDSSFTLTFLSKGRQLYGRGVLPLSTSAQTPVDCFWLLNQFENKPRAFYVLYDGYSSCYTDPDPMLINDKNLNDSRIFEVVGYETLGEIYRVDWNANDKRGSESSRLFESQINRLQSKAINLHAPEGASKSRIVVQAKQVKVHNIDLVQHLLPSNDLDFDQIYADIFPGFALATDQNETWTYSFPKTLEDRSMTWEHCEAACLADPTCKSFAFCSGWPEPSCTLCSVALDAPDISSMLSSSEAAGMTTISLDLNDVRVDLKRDFRCEIHNKLYMSMFDRSHSIIVTLANQQVFKVDNEDQCAEICFNRILDVLRISDSLEGDLDTTLAENEGNKFRASRIKLSRDFCDKFMFLDGTLDEMQVQQVERRLRPTSSTGDKSSYCLITDFDYDRTLTDFGKGSLAEQNIKFNLDVYKFDLTNLYARQPGISLLSSELTAEEATALRALQKLPSELEIRTLKVADEAGKNLQYSIRVTDAAQCALLCFFQTSGFYPSCQSFDFKGNGNYSICQLNTKSISKIEDDQLVERSTSSFHFEPRFKLVRGRAELDAQNWSLWFTAQASLIVSSSIWSSIMSFILLITAVGTGILIGSKFTEKWMAQRSRPRLASFANTNIISLNEEDI